MEINTLIAAVPFAKKVWRLTPAPLRLPLLLAGAAFLVWKYMSDRQDQAAASPTVTRPRSGTATH